MNQLSLFDSRGAEPVKRKPNLAYVRKSLRALLRTMRLAQTLPWNEADAAMWEKLFPELTALLPPDEGAPLLSEFQSEMARLRHAMEGK